MHTFEQALRTLPPCNACARASLLEYIHTAGHHLSGEVASLSVLAGALKHAVAAVEQARTELSATAPAPCRCSSEACTCHE
jgi:hypothetical protein